MMKTYQEITESFSLGEFEMVYPHLSNDVNWNIIGQHCFEGKHAVIGNCRKAATYFKTVTTDFRIKKIIADTKRIAIELTSEFSKAGENPAFVWACDIYEFNDQHEMEKITSYCIRK